MSDPGRAHEDQRTWDKWYGTGSRWSGRPNRALVDEATGLEPGTALDVGCGEGADAIWLASLGWQVTGMDPSMVALDRARAAAAARSARITWVRAGIQDLPPDIGQHDLVIAMYAVLPHTDDGAAITALLEAVAPGGTLLVVHHEGFPACSHQHGQGPGTYVTPDDVVARLDDGLTIEAHEARPPTTFTSNQGAGPRDMILRARRRSG
jgi:SAM-dependent methyltransferase